MLIFGGIAQPSFIRPRTRARSRAASPAAFETQTTQLCYPRRPVERALHSGVKCDGRERERERDLTWSARSGLQNSAPFIITPDVNSRALLAFCRHRRHLRLRRIHTRAFVHSILPPFYIIFFAMRQACNTIYYHAQLRPDTCRQKWRNSHRSTSG